jgi:hypothetical protein
VKARIVTPLRVVSVAAGVTVGLVTIDIFRSTLATCGWWRYWLQVLSGNWAPNDAPSIACPAYTPAQTGGALYAVGLSAVLAILLNLSVLTSILVGVRRLLVVESEIGDLREATMRLKDVYDLRDAVIKNRLLALLMRDQQARDQGLDPVAVEKFSSLLDDGFEGGDRLWLDQQLRVVLGDDGAQQVTDLVASILISQAGRDRVAAEPSA